MNLICRWQLQKRNEICNKSPNWRKTSGCTHWGHLPVSSDQKEDIVRRMEQPLQNNQSHLQRQGAWIWMFKMRQCWGFFGLSLFIYSLNDAYSHHSQQLTTTNGNLGSWRIAERGIFGLNRNTQSEKREEIIFTFRLLSRICHWLKLKDTCRKGK